MIPHKVKVHALASGTAELLRQGTGSCWSTGTSSARIGKDEVIEEGLTWRRCCRGWLEAARHKLPRARAQRCGVAQHGSSLCTPAAAGRLPVLAGQVSGGVREALQAISAGQVTHSFSIISTCSCNSQPSTTQDAMMKANRLKDCRLPKARRLAWYKQLRA